MSKIIRSMRINTDLMQAKASRERQAQRLEKKARKEKAKQEKLKRRNKDLHDCLYGEKAHKRITKRNLSGPVVVKIQSIVPAPESNEFLESYAWRRVRMEALKKHGAVCQCCGASRKTGAVIHVDHIKPRKLYPHLALDINNLQVLCHECNHGKGNWDTTDWR